MADEYANVASAYVTLSGATIVYNELQTGISLGQGQAIIIDKIEYDPTSAEMTRIADTEELRFGWSVTNALDTINLTKKGIVDLMLFKRWDDGAAAQANYEVLPFHKEFSPPLIVASPRIYLFGQGVAGSSGSVLSRMYFRYVKLSTQKYLELAEAFLLVG